MSSSNEDLPDVVLHADRESAALEAFLVDRVYEFNPKATGYFDGRSLAASARGASDEIIAALNGHTWGGCCVIAHLWVAEAYRRRGLGRTLLLAAEAEAAHRGCQQVVLSTHTFQAPGFYERLGYERMATIEGYPKRYADMIY